VGKCFARTGFARNDLMPDLQELQLKSDACVIKGVFVCSIVYLAELNHTLHYSHIIVTVCLPNHILIHFKLELSND